MQSMSNKNIYEQKSSRIKTPEGTNDDGGENASDTDDQENEAPVILQAIRNK